MQSADTYKKVEDRSSGSFDKLSDKLKVLREKETEFQKKVEKDFDSKQKKAPAAPTPAPAPPANMCMHMLCHVPFTCTKGMFLLAPMCGGLSVAGVQCVCTIMFNVQLNSASRSQKQQSGV